MFTYCRQFKPLSMVQWCWGRYRGMWNKPQTAPVETKSGLCLLSFEKCNNLNLYSPFGTLTLHLKTNIISTVDLSDWPIQRHWSMKLSQGTCRELRDGPTGLTRSKVQAAWSRARKRYRPVLKHILSHMSRGDTCLVMRQERINARETWGWKRNI